MSIHFQTSRETITVPCYRALNLLAHAQIEEIDIGSQCGGHGVCGGDRIQVLSEHEKLSPPTEAENKHLTKEEIQAGWRLACQTWPAKDDAEIVVMSRDLLEIG